MESINHLISLFILCFFSWGLYYFLIMVQYQILNILFNDKFEQTNDFLIHDFICYLIAAILSIIIPCQFIDLIMSIFI